MCLHCSGFSIRLQMAIGTTGLNKKTILEALSNLSTEILVDHSCGSLTEHVHQFVALTGKCKSCDLTGTEDLCGILNKVSKVIIYKIYEVCPKVDNLNYDKKVLLVQKLWSIIISKHITNHTNYCNWIESIYEEMGNSSQLQSFKKATQKCITTAKLSNTQELSNTPELPNTAKLPTSGEFPVYAIIIIGLVVFLFILVAAILFLCPHICRCKREEPENLYVHELYL